MTELPSGACWKAKDARVILATEALERNDAVFLSTHSPITDFEIGGSHAADVAESTEQGLLDALSNPSVRHAFCVVEGEPGSGKSHLIRWLKVRWPDDETLEPLLIQRLDGSLQGTLRQLQRVLPEEHQHLFDVIGRTQELTLAGRARVFHTNLALALRPDHFAVPLEDAHWCGQFSLAELIGDSALLDQWKAPERIVELLSGKKGKRDQELARFNLADIAELEQLLRPRRAPSPRSVRFKNELKKEADAIRQLDRNDILDPRAQEEFRAAFEFSYKLADALNDRHNAAVQNVLGISADGLKELFFRLRRELRGRRLVLLLEDITAWEGVDQQLIDVLVTNAETREENDLCPMISVVGLTPAYFQTKSFQSNYRQRITQHIRLGNPSRNHDYQEVSALRTKESQVAFAAKYLRATRAGVERLAEWGGSGAQVPNRCDTCRCRVGCHNEFGAHDGIGLYPFNEHAITTLYSLLRDPQHAATYQTPRGMLQGVLSPTLQHADVLEHATYPGPEIETELLVDDDRRLFGPIEAVLKAQVENDRERERLRRLIRYWKDQDQASILTKRADDGSLVFGGVRQNIYKAFNLPWLGAADVSTTVEDEEQNETRVDEAEDIVEETDGNGTAKPVRPEQKPKVKKGGTGVPARKRLTNEQMRAVQQDVANWCEGQTPQRAGLLNQLAFEIVDQLKWRHLAISDWVKGRLFTPDTVMLRDTKVARVQHLVLDRTEWAKNGIEAYFGLRSAADDLTDVEQEGYRRAYANMHRKLGAAVVGQVRERLPKLPSGTNWDIATAAAQVLLSRAWLRGNTSPTAPAFEQWLAVIRNEGDVTSSPQDRVDSWNGMVNATSGMHGALRSLLRQLLSLPQYQPDPDNTDPATALALLGRDLVVSFLTLPVTFRGAELPSSTKGLGEKLQELERLAELAQDMDQKLRAIPRYEVERLVNASESVQRISRNSSLREHIKRVDSLVDQVATQLAHHVAQPVQEWRVAKQKLEAQGFLRGDSDNPGIIVEEFIDGVTDGNWPKQDDLSEALSWAVHAPAGHLRAVQVGLEVGERTIGRLLEYVQEFVEGHDQSLGSIEEIHRVGGRIRTAVDSARRDLEAKHNA